MGETPLSDTIRERIIQNIMTRLGLIRTANGYLTAIGANVYRVRKRLEEEECPGCVVFPRPEEGSVTYGRQVCDMPVDVEAAALFGDTNASIVAEQLLGDLIKALIATDPTGGLAESVQYVSGGTPEYPEDGDLSVGVTVRVMVKYETLKGNPFSQ